MGHFDRAAAYERCKAISDDVELLRVELANGGQPPVEDILGMIMRDMQDLAEVVAGLLQSAPDTA